MRRDGIMWRAVRAIGRECRAYPAPPESTPRYDFSPISGFDANRRKVFTIGLNHPEYLRSPCGGNRFGDDGCTTYL